MSENPLEETKLGMINTLLKGKWQKEEKEVVLSDIEKILRYKETAPCEICGGPSAKLRLIFKRVVFCCAECFSRFDGMQRQLGIVPEEVLDDFASY